MAPLENAGGLPDQPRLGAATTAKTRHGAMPSPAWRTLGLALALFATTLAVCHGASDRQVLLSKEVQRESGDAVGVFQLREGDVLADAVAAFGRSVGLTPGEEASLLANVQQQAVSLRLVPLKSMDITLPGGRRITSLQIFEGDSVRDVVLGAADSQGVTEEPLREELVATVFKVGASASCLSHS